MFKFWSICCNFNIFRQSDNEVLAHSGYSIGSTIGRGSFGTVMTSTYTNNSGQQVQLACKIIDKTKASSTFINKFLPRELEILRKVDHPNIVRTHSIVQKGSKVFIFMHFAENGSLLDHIRKSGPVKESQAKNWFLQMARALKYLHSCDIAHRDIKCENVLLSENLNVRLADFGFARYCRNETGQVIKSETYCGSQAYEAPEVLRECPYDPKVADAWSLGVVLFAMLNGKLPFDTGNLAKALHDQEHRRYVFNENLQDEISAPAKATVAVLLEPQVQERWNINEILNCTWLKIPTA